MSKVKANKDEANNLKFIRAWSWKVLVNSSADDNKFAVPHVLSFEEISVLD